MTTIAINRLGNRKARGGWLFTWLAVALLRWASGQSLQENEIQIPIHLPLCCPSEHVFSPTTNTCVYNNLIPFRLQVIIRGSLVTVTNTAEQQEGTTLPCDENSSEAGYDYVALNSDQSTLMQMNDGTFNLVWLTQDANLFDKSQQFCVMMVLSGTAADEPIYWAKVCLKDRAAQWERDRLACTNASCVRKCCPAGEHLINQRICTPDDDNRDWIMQSKFSDMHIVYGMPKCKTLLLYPDIAFNLLPSGYVRASEMLYSPQEYCIEYNEDIQEQQMKEQALICHMQSQELECLWKQNVVIPALMGVSCACLVLTWVVYVIVPHLRTTNMGRCLLSFVSAMFIAFLTIIINQVGRGSFSDVQCTLTATLSHISILATFFWLNVMSLHIFFHLRSPLKEDGSKMRIFLLYSLYAWGCPLLVALTGLTLDALQAPAIRPHFHLPNCWFKDETSRWAYQYGIIVTLVVINMFFFVSSVMLLRQRQKHRQETGYYQTISAWVFVKLLIITGVLWITEVLTWQINNQCSIVVVILDIINSLQGVFIFCAAVCFRKDLKVFHRGWPELETEAETALQKRNDGEVTELIDAPPRTD